MSRDTFLTDWTAAVDAFNRGDSGPMGALYAEGATHTTEDGTVPRRGPAIVSDLYEPARSATGWRHVITSISVHGEFVTSLYTNRFADGTVAQGGGLVRLDDAGKIAAVYSWTQAGVTTPLSRPT